MAAVATGVPTSPPSERASDGRTGRLFDGGATLEDAILRALDELGAEGRADCPVCGGVLEPLHGCASCGCELS